MQDLSDFALPCTVTQVLYNGPMYISPEEDLSGQIFNLGSVGSVLPSDLQGIQADDGSRKLGLQTANGGRTDANPVAYPKKECGLAPTDHGAKWSHCTGFIDIQRWEEVFGVLRIVGVQRSDGTFGERPARRVSQPRYAGIHRSSLI